MRSPYSTILVLMLALGFTLGPVSNLFAQDDDDVFMLEEITVTAERRASNLQKSALAITALTSDTLDQKQLNTLDDALSQAPNIQIQGLANGASIFIRGIGDSDEGTPSVATNVDGVYLSSSEGITQSIYDVERIEVLRGPSGTMYGRNSTGGAVNIVTASPKSEYQASGSLQIGNYNEVRTSGMVNVPVTDTVAMRAAFETERHEGYLTNGNMDSDTRSARFKIGYTPTENFKIVSSFEYKFDASKPGTVGSPLSDGSEWDTGDLETWPQNVDEKTSYTYSLNLDWTTEWGTITFIPSYNTFEEYQATKLIGEAEATVKDTAQTTAELRIASPAESKLTWVGGLFYLKPEENSSGSSGIYNRITAEYETAVSVANSEGQVYNYESDGGSYQMAAFAQATYPLAAKLRVTGGVRFTKDYSSTDYYITVDDVKSGDTVSVDTGASKTMYKVGVEYDLGDESMLYSAVSTGYNAGGFNSSESLGLIEYDPEELVSYTIGAKNRFLNDRLQVNLEAFYYDYTNQQIQYSSVYNEETGKSERLMTNVGKSTMYGGEVENTIMLTAHDRLTLNAAYLYAMYDEFNYIDYGFSGVGTTYDYDDTEMPNSPEFSGNIEYEHDFLLSNGATLAVNGNLKYSDEYYTTFEKTYADSLQESYYKTDAYVAYHAPDGNWSVKAYVKNIENEAVKIYTMPNDRLMIGDPRTYGIRFSAKF